MNKFSKYIFPTLSIMILLVGILIGNAVSNRANAQRIMIQNGRLLVEPSFGKFVKNFLQFFSLHFCYRDVTKM